MLFFEIIKQYVNHNNVKLTLQCPLLGWSLDSTDLTNPKVYQCLESLTYEQPILIFEHLSETKQLVTMFYINFALDSVVPADEKEAVLCYKTDFLRSESNVIDIPPELEFQGMTDFITKIDWAKHLYLQEEEKKASKAQNLQEEENKTCKAQTEALVMNVEPINQTGRSKFILKTTQELMKENLVLIGVPVPFIKYYYPLDKASEQVKNRLLSGVVLTPEFENIRKILHDVTDDKPHFIHSLLTHWVVDDEVIDLSEVGYRTIGSVNNVPLMTYVSAPGYENIFFVIENIGEGKIKCIEVHKRKLITYRTVILRSSQVKQTKRITSGVPAINLQEVLFLEEPELSARMMEIEVADREFEEKYKKEDEGEK